MNNYILLIYIFYCKIFYFFFFFILRYFVISSTSIQFLCILYSIPQFFSFKNKSRFIQSISNVIIFRFSIVNVKKFIFQSFLFQITTFNFRNIIISQLSIFGNTIHTLNRSFEMVHFFWNKIICQHMSSQILFISLNCN